MVEVYASMRDEARARAEAMTKEDKGKFIVCNVSNHTNKRVDITAINTLMWQDDARRFTLMSKTVDENGYYLCRVEAYKLDKKNNIILIVEPLALMDGFDYFDYIWDYFIVAGLTYSPYMESRRTSADAQLSYNLDALYNMVGAPVEWTKKKKDAKVMEELISGHISVKDVSIALEAPTELDLACAYVRDMMKLNTVEFAQKYPNLYKRVSSDENPVNLREMMKKWRDTYIFKGIGNSDSYVEQAEEVIAYYKSYNKTKKRIEKANKKAAKAV